MKTPVGASDFFGYGDVEPLTIGMNHKVTGYGNEEVDSQVGTRIKFSIYILEVSNVGY